MILALGVLPAVLLVAGFPVFLALLAAAIAMLLMQGTVPLTAVHQNLFSGLNSVNLLAVPFFIFAGELMARGSIARRLIGFVRPMTARLPGGLGVTTVGTATIFGAISGASAATVVSVGKIMHRGMTADGYPAPFSAGMVTTVGAIGIIIPPSIPMIVYGAASETSIPRLYAAGVLPGLLLAGALAVFIVLRARIGGYGRPDTAERPGLLAATRDAAWALGAPVIVLGGIYGGVFSPTEAAAVACLYALVVTRLVFRELGWAEIRAAAEATVVFTSQVLLVVAAASLYAWLLTINQVPQAVVAWIGAAEIGPVGFLLAVNVILLVWGCFMDPLSAILLLTPLLIPVVNELGIDKVHFGIVMTLNLAIGLFTPPFGINIFVAQSALGLPTRDIYRGVLPFLAVFLVVLAVVTFVPAISTAGVGLFLDL